MKKFLPILLSSLLLLSGCGSSSSAPVENPVEKYGSKTLKLFTWGEYLGENVIQDFEKTQAIIRLMNELAKGRSENLSLTGLVLTVYHSLVHYF